LLESATTSRTAETERHEIVGRLPQEAKRELSLYAIRIGLPAVGELGSRRYSL